jgi:hypothetical protein
MVWFTERMARAGAGRKCLTKGVLFARESAFVEGGIPVCPEEGVTGFCVDQLDHQQIIKR